MSELPVIQSPVLDLPGVRHAFFTRQGGVSDGIYESLNLGLGSNDDRGRVMQNRRRAAAHLGLGPERLLTCYQIHSAEAVAAFGPWSDGAPEADAVVAATPNLACGALAADCAPILFADPDARVVAAAHAGWKGALGGVIEATVGPCIAQESYEVGLEFLERFTAHDPEFEAFFAPGAAPDKRQFDLPGFVLERLAAAGVRRAEWVGRDTCAEPDLFYSNRRAFKAGERDYGRLLSAIVLV